MVQVQGKKITFPGDSSGSDSVETEFSAEVKGEKSVRKPKSEENDVIIPIPETIRVGTIISIIVGLAYAITLGVLIAEVFPIKFPQDVDNIENYCKIRPSSRCHFVEEVHLLLIVFLSLLALLLCLHLVNCGWSLWIILRCEPTKRRKAVTIFEKANLLLLLAFVILFVLVNCWIIPLLQNYRDYEEFQANLDYTQVPITGDSHQTIFYVHTGFHFVLLLSMCICTAGFAKVVNLLLIVFWLTTGITHSFFLGQSTLYTSVLLKKHYTYTEGNDTLMYMYSSNYTWLYNKYTSLEEGMYGTFCMTGFFYVIGLSIFYFRIDKQQRKLQTAESENKSQQVEKAITIVQRLQYFIIFPLGSSCFQYSFYHFGFFGYSRPSDVLNPDSDKPETFKGRTYVANPFHIMDIVCKGTFFACWFAIIALSDCWPRGFSLFLSNDNDVMRPMENMPMPITDIAPIGFPYAPVVGAGYPFMSGYTMPMYSPYGYGIGYPSTIIMPYYF